MSIASRIEEIETHIGDVYDTINYSYDTTGINKNIINIPKYLKKGYIDIINNGIDTLYNNFPKVSGIGSNLSLTPTYEAPMKLNEIQGDTLQDGTPTPDSPVEIQSVTGNQEIKVTGKNLCNNVALSNSNNDIFFYFDKDISQTFTLSATINSATSGNSIYLILNGSSLGKVGEITGSANTKQSVTITFTNEIYEQIQNSTTRYLQLYKNNAGFTLPTDAQIENGSSNTDYEEYKGNTYEVNLGKNLLNIPDGTYINNGITAVSSNGIITLNGTATNTSFIVITLLKEIVEENQTLTISNNNQENISDNLTEVRLLTTVGDYIPCSFKQINNSTTRTNLTGTYNRLQIRTSSGVSFNNFVIKPMLEKGSSKTTYSPYFTPIELNKIGTYKDSIKKSTGKNLFDINGTVTQGTLDKYNNGFTLVKGTNRVIRFVLPKVLPAGTYTLSYDTINVENVSGNYFYVSCQYTNTNIGILNNIILNDSGATFTTTDEFDRLYFFIAGNQSNNATITIDNVQLEQNNQATTYEPYGKVWYVEKQIGKVVLNGSEGWGLASTYTNNTRFSSSSLILGKTTNLISNYFVEGQGGTDTTNIDTNGTTGALMITIPNNIASTLSQFTTWLSTHNTIVYYVLATPEYTEITNTELIEDLETLYTAKSQEGTTNISITSEDLEMILNVSALKGEV